jgi:hypothetical protein
MPAALRALVRSGAQALAKSRWADRQVGTLVRGSGMGPSTNTAAPVAWIWATVRVRLVSHGAP